MKQGRRDFLKKASLGVVGTAIAAVGIKEVEASSTEIVEIDIPEDLAEICDFDFFEETKNTEILVTGNFPPSKDYLPIAPTEYLCQERMAFGKNETVEIPIRFGWGTVYIFKWTTNNRN